jgi:tetratricopeptide (TPR) repeat protein
MQGDQYLRAAYGYLYIRDFLHAKEAFEKAIAANPDNALYYFHASITALRNDLFDLAIIWAMRATELEPDNPMYQQHVDIVQAAIYHREAQEAFANGDFERAIEQFQAALDLDPLNDEALRVLERLKENLFEQSDEKQEGTF